MKKQSFTKSLMLGPLGKEAIEAWNINTRNWKIISQIIFANISEHSLQERVMWVLPTKRVSWVIPKEVSLTLRLEFSWNWKKRRIFSRITKWISFSLPPPATKGNYVSCNTFSVYMSLLSLLAFMSSRFLKIINNYYKKL